MPSGAPLVVMTSAGGLIFTVNDALFVACALSFTVAETVNVPAVSGVPVRAPAVSALTPLGRPETVHV